MADVSVEFGAQDTGLEATLKTVQAEMSRLETEIKSGELSFNELTGSMRDLSKAEKVSQQLQSIGGAAAGASPQVDKLGKDGKEMGDNVKKGSDKGGMSLGELAKASGVAGAAFAAGMAVFNAAMAGVQAVAASFGKAIDMGGQLADLSAQTGVAAGELLVLQRAFDNTGAGAEKVSPAIAKMSSSIVDAMSGTGAAAKAFDQLGLSAEALINLPAEQQFQKIGTALAGVSNETERSALASDLFGSKLGKDLLPLMTNFSGETRTATQQLGSMVGVMNENSDAFDSIGDGIKVAQGKLTEFAAGLMSVMAPAIEAVVTALTRIDAAQIGKDLGSAFVGAGEAMKGFQSAVDAFEAGNIGLALKSIFESVKLQAMQTADEIYKRLIAAFQSAGQFLAEIFSPSGALISTVLDGFDLLGARIAETIQSKLAAALSGNFLTQGISDNLRVAAEESKLAADKISESMTGAGGRIAEQFVNAGKALPDSFSENYAKIPPLFDDLAAQQAKVAELEGQVTAATAATAAEHANTNIALTTTGTLTEQLAKTEEALTKAIADGNTQLAEQLAQQQGIFKKKIAAQALEAKSKSDKTALIELETQLNAAKAAGNIELATALEKQLEQKKATQEITKLTAEYEKNLGLSNGEAALLATNFVNAKNAAAGVKVDKTTVSEAKAEASKAAEAAKSFATWLDYIKGVDPSAPVKSLKEKTADARKEITAFGEYIGVDLKNKSYPDVARELGIKNLGTTGSEQMQQILDYIATKRGELTGIQPIDEAGSKTALENISQTIKDKIGSINSQITTQSDDNIIASTKSTIERGLSGIPLTFTVDPEQIKKSIGTIDVSGGAGGGIMGEIKGLVDTIKGFVEKIEAKLPMTALA